MKVIRRVIYAFTFLMLCGKVFAQNTPVHVYDFHQDQVNSVDFSPDSRLIASGSDDGTVQIIDVQTGAIRIILKDHQDEVDKVEFSKDGQSLISASQNKIIVIDTQSFQKVQEVGLFINISNVHTGLNDDIYFFAQRGEETPVAFFKFRWKTMTYSSVYAYSSSINDYAISKDGNFMFIAKGKTVLILDLTRNMVVKELEESSKIFSLDTDLQHAKLITSKADGMFIWSIDKSNGIPYPGILKSDKVYLSSDASYFAYLIDGNLVFREALGLKDININTGKESIRDFAFNNAENWVATVGESTAIKVWDNPMGKGNSSGMATVSTFQTTSSSTAGLQPDPNHVLSRAELTEEVLMGMYGSLIDADLALRSDLFAPKDEFEKTSDYELRLASARKLRVSTFDFYRDKYMLDVEYKRTQDSLERVKKMALLEEKIRNSYREVSFPIDVVGSYDADKETFPVTVRGVQQMVKIPISEAKEFKENYQSAEVKGVEQLAENGVNIDVFNLMIIHPITKSRYPFGIQKKPLFMGATTTYTTTQTTKSPPNSTTKPTSTTRGAVSTAGISDDSGITEENLAEKLRERRNYAFIIGVQNYLDQSVTDLEYPVNDGSKLADALTTRYTFARGNVITLNDPSREDIIRTFRALASAVKPTDNLVIFFAGQGLWDEQSGQGYWLPSDAKSGSKAAWISNSEIRDFIKGIGSKHTLLISDACFSGSIFNSRNASNESKSNLELYKLPSRTAITSGSLKTGSESSVLVEYLVKRLIENNKDLLSASELFSNIKGAVSSNSSSLQEPQYGEVKEAGDEGGDFFFVKQ